MGVGEGEFVCAHVYAAKCLCISQYKREIEKGGRGRERERERESYHLYAST